MSTFRLFAACSRGLGDILKDELKALFPGKSISSTEGGAILRGSQSDLWRLVWNCRTAESVHVQVGGSQRVRSAAELRSSFLRLPWSAYLKMNTANVHIKAESYRSQLFHETLVKQTIRGVLEDHSFVRPTKRKGDFKPSVEHVRQPDGQVITRALKSDDTSTNVPSISTIIKANMTQMYISATGDDLYRRGYRTHVTWGPMRETLAAACVRAAGIQQLTSDSKSVSLWDPFCGSGVIVLEALAISLGWPAPMTPRRFPFEFFPIHDSQQYAAFQTEQLARRDKLSLPSNVKLQLLGSDIAVKAVSAAEHNALLAQAGNFMVQSSPNSPAASAQTSAGLAQVSLQFLQGDFEEISSRVPQHSIILTNPPYGYRSEQYMTPRQLSDMFERFGVLLKSRPDITQVYVLMVTHNNPLPQTTGLQWQPVLTSVNGGVPVQLLKLVR